MVGLLTWPAYGTWFARPDRGWIDRDGDGAETLPEPTRSHARSRQRLKWPPVMLNVRQQAVVIGDLIRVAGLRNFDLLAAAAAPDHVHALLDCAPDRDVPRLVQLIKGATSRALTVDAGDEPACSTRGTALVHHKWWTRQYSFRWIDDPAARRRVLEALWTHATVWVDPRQAAEAAGDIGE
jgi:REP element-mobilizing transposase RayT